MRIKTRSNEELKHLQFRCHSVLMVSTSSLEKQNPERSTGFVSNKQGIQIPQHCHLKIQMFIRQFESCRKNVSLVFIHSEITRSQEDCSDEVAQGFIQLSIENLQGWRLLGLSGLPLPLPDCPQGEKDSPYIQSCFSLGLLFLIFRPCTTMKSPTPSCQ